MLSLTLPSPVLKKKDFFKSTPILDQKPEPLISHYPSESVKAVSKPSRREVKRELIDLTFLSPPTERHITNRKRSSSVMWISDSSDASQPIQLHSGNPWNRHTNLSTICLEIQLGSTFDSPQTAQEVVFAYQENLGHRWRVAQSKRGTNGSKRKVTFHTITTTYHLICRILTPLIILLDSPLKQTAMPMSTSTLSWVRTFG